MNAVEDHLQVDNQDEALYSNVKRLVRLRQERVSTESDFQQSMAGDSAAKNAIVASSFAALHVDGTVVVDDFAASPDRMSGIGTEAYGDRDAIQASSIEITVLPTAPAFAGAGVFGNDYRDGDEMHSQVDWLKDQFDTRSDLRLTTGIDQPGRDSLNQVRADGDGATAATFRAEIKDKGNARVETLMAAQDSTHGFGESGWGGHGGMWGKSTLQAKKEATVARIEAEGDTLTVPKAGIGMLLKEIQLPDGDTILAVKSLAPGAPALSSGMINRGDILLTVDGKRVKTRQDATKSILGEFGSSISLQMERDGESFVVSLLRAGITHHS